MFLTSSADNTPHLEGPLDSGLEAPMQQAKRVAQIGPETSDITFVSSWKTLSASEGIWCKATVDRCSGPVNEPERQEPMAVDGKRLRRRQSRRSLPGTFNRLGSRSPRSSRSLNSSSCSIRGTGSRSYQSGRISSRNPRLGDRSSSSPDLRGSLNCSSSKDFGNISPTSKVPPVQARGKTTFCLEQPRSENPYASAPESEVLMQEESESAAEANLGTDFDVTLFSGCGRTTTHSSVSLPNCLPNRLRNHEPADSIRPINVALNNRSVRRSSSHPSLSTAETRDQKPSRPCRSRSPSPTPPLPCTSRPLSPSPSRGITSIEAGMLGEIVDSDEGEYEHGSWGDSSETRVKNRETLKSMNSDQLASKSGREKRRTDAFSSARMMKIKETPGNETCADCPAQNPEWASFLKKKRHSTAKRAVLCCRACAQAHHYNLGEKRCRIKYIKMYVIWILSRVDAAVLRFLNRSFLFIRFRWSTGLMNVSKFYCKATSFRDCFVGSLQMVVMLHL
jgi:hypothetical protein